MVYLVSSLVFFSLLFLHHFFSDGLLTDLTLSSPPWNTFLLSIRQRPYQGLFDLIYSHVSILQSAFLICTLISENQGIEKLRPVSNLKKISGPALLDFVSVCHLDFFLGLWYKFRFFSKKKNPGLQDQKFF